MSEQTNLPSANTHQTNAPEQPGVPKGLRLHIALFGRRNVGKSSLLNALAGQEAAIVSPVPGATTDPVEKTMELAPLGPVVLIDTAGLDEPEAGEAADAADAVLGRQRVERSLKVMGRADVALLVTEGTLWGEDEARIASLLAERGLPFAVALNKLDEPEARAEAAAASRPPDLDAKVPVIPVSARLGLGLDEIRRALAELAPESALDQPHLLRDLLPEHGLAALVVPIDSGAPKGRLILPQVQSIRDCLDGRALCLVATAGEWPRALARLSSPPDVVICDSQVVREVVKDTPPDLPLTTFSIIMARLKADLPTLARGAAALSRLKPGDAVEIQEACSHHPQKDDIARVKLPKLLQKLAGGPLNLSWYAGREFPEYDGPPRVIVHCGACVLTRGQMLARLHAANRAGCPMTNYGMAISLAQGVLERALSPFPEALAAFREARQG